MPTHYSDEIIITIKYPHKYFFIFLKINISTNRRHYRQRQQNLKYKLQHQ